MKFIKVLIGIFAVIGVIVVCLGVGFLFGMKNQTTTSVPDEPTITPVVTENLIPESTVTNVPTPTSEPEPTATSAPTPTSTPVPTVTVAPTATSTPTPTVAPTATSTPTPSPEPTATPTPKYTYSRVTGNHYMYTTKSVNVYAGPSEEFEIIGTIEKGLAVFVSKYCNETGWYESFRGDLEGYIDNDYLIYIEDESSTPTPTSEAKPTATPTATPKPTATPTPKPTKEASITASKTELLFTSVEPQTIYITFNVEGQFRISGKITGDKIVTSSWGEWQEDGITKPVTITPNFNGTTTIQYYIVDTNLSIDIKITVDIESLPEIPELGEEQIVVSQTEMIFKDMEPQILYVKVKDGKEIYGSRIGNASYEAGKWSGNVLPVVITPTSSGTSTFEISLAGDDSVFVKVKIRVEIYPDREIFTSLETVDLADAYAGAIVKFGTYEQDNNLSNGAEEIEWLVLDVQDGKALLLSKYALDCRLFDSIYDFGDTWEESKLRPWLQKDFYQQAFSTYEQSKICEVDIGTPDTITWNSVKKNLDTVFVLSCDEVNKYFTDKFLSDEYGNSLLKRAAVATPYAISQGASVSLNEKSDDYGLAMWWTRTTKGENAYCIESDGGMALRSIYGYEINGFTGDKRYFSCCARPAIWVDIE